ncbi:MAG: dephospho-CoA kinase, partial [Chloroflexi bacterium]|nr:dephospho-CoA kinase [Chloroflexota bacterium]
MSRVFPDKYVIGLTGNIATGKSVVRKMLEHLGAYGIDADRLAHRAIARGAPGYRPVVETFGRWIVGPDGEIDRRKLGRIVFSDPEALAHLEAIVHPLVEQAIRYLVRNAPHKVVVIEAIKLLESGLHKMCDAIWVVDAPPEVQLERLVKQRGLSAEEARQRIMAQPPQALKRARADVIIDNSRTYEYTWRQVVDAWMKLPGVAPLRPRRRTVSVPAEQPQKAKRPRQARPAPRG